MSVHKTPFAMLRLSPTPDSALESLIPQTNNFIAEIAPLSQIIPEESQLEDYLLKQFVLYLYINIFITPQTSDIYSVMLRKALINIRNQAAASRDVELRSLLDQGFLVDLTLLEKLTHRYQLVQNHAGINHILMIINSIYNQRKPYISSETIIISKITLEFDDADQPIFSLTPVFQQNINTQGIEACRNLLWKFIYSLRIPEQIRRPNDFSNIMTSLAQLALPMDPMSVMAQMRQNMIYNQRAGIPFLNYLAMYLKQKAMGLDYTLSQFADTRRILMAQLHRFCGIGGFTLSDSEFVVSFMQMIENDLDIKVFSDDDQSLFDIIDSAMANPTIRFTRALSYTAGLEAKDPTKSAPKKAKDDAFADDANMTADDTSADESDSSTNPDDTSNDNIDRTSDVGQDSAVANKKLFMPLALPTETIDDHLLRLQFLKLTDDLDKDPAPDITPENLDMMKYWCESWLFIASIDQTKKLLSRLELTGKLKELVS